jgi:hypothetical protein
VERIGTDSLIAISRDQSRWDRPCADDLSADTQRGHQEDRYGSRPPLESHYSTARYNRACCFAMPRKFWVVNWGGVPRRSGYWPLAHQSLAKMRLISKSTHTLNGTGPGSRHPSITGPGPKILRCWRQNSKESGGHPLGNARLHFDNDAVIGGIRQWQGFWERSPGSSALRATWS